MHAGEEVICLDKYLTGRKTNINRWNGNNNFEMAGHLNTEPTKLEID